MTPSPSFWSDWSDRWRRLPALRAFTGEAAPPAPGDDDPFERPRLPRDLARKVRRIEIATRRLVDQGIAGDYHSVFKGQGMEFAEVRPYQEGDDVRTIDWNVTARMGQPYVKRYVEERDQTVFLAVDVSGSLSFGSGAITKRDLAAEVTALLAFAAVRNGDRVGAALFSEGVDTFVAPSRRRHHVLRIVREVLVRPAAGRTDLPRSLDEVLGALERRSILFLVSDFLTPLAPSQLRSAAARHDLVVVEITDPRDLELPATSPVVLTDAETGRTAVVSGRSAVERHRRSQERRRRELRATLNRLGVDLLALTTDRPYLDPLAAFFEARRRRLHR